MGDGEEFWRHAKSALPGETLGDRYVLRRMGNSQALSENLLGMVSRGEKTAIFSRPEDLEAAGLTPSVGDYVIFADFDGTPRCLVRIEECRVFRFIDVGPEQTACESPAARDVEVWRGIHSRYWTRFLAERGLEFSEGMHVLFQRFRVLYSAPA